MRLEDMLKNVSGITNRVIKENCWEGQFNVLEGIQVLQSKINEIIVAINNGIIKGDKGDTPNVQVGETTTLEPGNNASVTQTGDMLNPIFNFEIPKGEKGDKGDTGKASESIQDNVVGLDTCWSSQKTVGYVDKMFNSLQDVKGVNYATDKDYFVATGSKNGVVKDLKINGRSLVNLCDINRNFKGVATSYRTIGHSLYPVKNNSIYTFIVKNKSNNNIKIYSNENMFSLVEKIIKPGEICIFRSMTKDIFNEPGDITDVLKLNPNNEASVNVDFDFMLLEGDFTQNPPSYFEGIVSVGNGYGIEVLSRNKNIAKEVVPGTINTTTGEYMDNSNVNRLNKVRILHNTKYTFSRNNTPRACNKFFYDKDNKFIGTITGVDSTFITPTNAYYLSLTWGTTIEDGNYQLEMGGNVTSYVKPIEYKKPILFKDTDGAWNPVTELRGISNSFYDTIENSKYNKKIDEIVLDETLNYTLWKPNPNAVNTIMFSLSNVKIKRGSQFSPISNLFVNRIGVPKEPISTFKDLDKEGIGYWDSSISLFVSINKSHLETPDVAGFKKLLKKWNDEGQPLKVMYEKEVCEQYEVNPLDLQSFENETMILFKYGVVNGTSEFYIDSNLGSITIENMERLSRIENEIYQVKKIVLNGDYRTMAQSTYPEDFKEVVKYE